MLEIFCAMYFSICVICFGMDIAYKIDGGK